MLSLRIGPPLENVGGAARRRCVAPGRLLGISASIGATRDR
jgi:hypothetical protein